MDRDLVGAYVTAIVTYANSAPGIAALDEFPGSVSDKDMEAILRTAKDEGGDQQVRETFDTIIKAEAVLYLSAIVDENYSVELGAEMADAVKASLREWVDREWSDD